MIGILTSIVIQALLNNPHTSVGLKIKQLSDWRDNKSNIVIMIHLKQTYATL